MDKKDSIKPQPRVKLLNLLLKGSLALGLFALSINLFAYINSLRLGYEHRGDNPLNVLLYNLIFLFLISITKKGYYRLSSWVFTFLFMFGGLYTAYYWGADVPQALLLFAVDIIIAGILLGARASFFITIVITLTLLVITYLQSEQIIQIESHWKENILGVADTIMTSITLFIITIVTWLSNRELESSLKRAERSEKALKKERDLLETRVEERTQKLKLTQMEKVSQLYRFADFGKLASGLMHDLINPLTSVSLNIEQLASQSKTLKTKDLANIDAVIKRAKNGIDRMEGYVQAARKQIQQQDISKVFSIKDEIAQVVKIFSYRQKNEQIHIELEAANNLKTYGNPIAFNQMMSNLVSNALDSYENTNAKKKDVSIRAFKKRGIIYIEVTDHGEGISNKAMPHIFNPFFTTKGSEKGTGIGLSITKKTVEESFKGTISVKSSKKDGTIFTISFPYRKNRITA